ncbi:hypothetical protein ACTJI9_21005 [Phyllobacterium sp. 22552]
MATPAARFIQVIKRGQSHEVSDLRARKEPSLSKAVECLAVRGVDTSLTAGPAPRSREEVEVGATKLNSEEKPVSFSTFQELGYGSAHSQLLIEAHRLASHALNRHPHNHEHSSRLATTIMNFCDRGIKDPGVLSTLAVNRERALERKQEKDIRTAKRRIKEQKRRSRATGRSDDLLCQE